MVARASRLAPLRITYTTDPRDVDVGELADLMARCATHAPGNAVHAAEARADPAAGPPADPARFRRRLRSALSNSLVCVAAYAPESALPPALRLSPAAAPPADPLRGVLARVAPSLGPKVLVGFVRAVGDAALVATIHDATVAPEVRGRGLGAALVGLLTRKLYYMDIIDVGTIVPENLARFWGDCSFGDDSEASVAMALSGAGAAAWARDGGGMVERVLKKRRARKGGGGEAAVAKAQAAASVRSCGT